MPKAGNLHHFNVVTVRQGQFATAAIPVGEVIDPRELTETLTDDAGSLAQLSIDISGQLPIAASGAAEGSFTARIVNPVNRSVDYMLTYASEDSRWIVSPDHLHGTLGPNEVLEVPFDAVRVAGKPDATFRALELSLSMDMLTEAFRYPIPEVRASVPLDVSAARPGRQLGRGNENHAVRVGPDACVAVASDAFELADGPLTVECWFNAEQYRRRMGLIAKTEGSDYGIFVSNGQPHFSVHVGGGYVDARAEDVSLETGRWHHIAGVFDGSEVRLYVDGRLVASAAGSGSRRTNEFPLMIGADVSRWGQPTSVFRGQIDDVRVSNIARYSGERFTPPAAVEADSMTALMLHFDDQLGPYFFGDSAAEVVAEVVGTGANTSTGGVSLSPAQR